MSSSENESYSDAESSENEQMSDIEESEDRKAIREDLKTMTFEEIMKLKDELGVKVYKEAILGSSEAKRRRKTLNKDKADFKRLNKNRPREAPSNRPVPFLGAEFRNSKKFEKQIRDPRFDEKAGTYDAKIFKENYKFLGKIRSKEIITLQKKIKNTQEKETKDELRKEMQKLINKNVEEEKWHKRQNMLKEEQEEIKKAKAEGKTPHYTTKKERRAKELVMQFEDLKQQGKLNKHLEKRRKKLLAKDRKKTSFD